MCKHATVEWSSTPLPIYSITYRPISRYLNADRRIRKSRAVWVMRWILAANVALMVARKAVETIAATTVATTSLCIHHVMDLNTSSIDQAYYYYTWHDSVLAICTHWWIVICFYYCIGSKNHPILHLLWAVFNVFLEGFFGYRRLSPQTWTALDETWNIREVRTHTTPQGFHLKIQKRVLFSRSPVQCRFSATYPAPIWTTFEIKGVNRCARA